MLTEVHVYAVAIAANMLLAFFPFLIVLVSLCTHVFHWADGGRAVLITVVDYFPGDMSGPIARIAEYPGAVQIVSILLLLLTPTADSCPWKWPSTTSWGFPKNAVTGRNSLGAG